MDRGLESLLTHKREKRDMTDITLKPINSGYNLQKINDNFDTLEAVINDDILHLDGDNNVMKQELDMNSNRILNLPEPTEPTDVVRLQDLVAGSVDLPTFSRDTFNVVDGQTTYTLSTPMQSTSIVVVDGEILPPKSYSVSIDGDLVLSQSLSNEEITIEVYTNFTPPIEVVVDSSAVTVNLPSDIHTESLAGIDIIITRNGVVDGDNFGGVFAYTGTTDISKAGTTDTSNALVYNVTGREYKFSESNISLEQLGVPYTESTTIVIGYVMDLRSAGFVVDLSPRYSLTDFDGRRVNQYTEKMMILHRGLEDYAPQNTLLAFSIAINSTLSQNIAVEFDVQITSDGVPIVFHDLSVDDLTNGTGEVKNLTYAYISGLEFTELAGTVFESDVHIPSLDMVVEYLAERGVAMYPETKGYRTVADIELMTDVIAKYNRQHVTVWNSFRIDDLVGVRSYSPQSPIGLVKEGVITQGEVDTLEGLGGEVEILAGISYLLANPVDAAIFRSHGWGVSGWTVTRYETIQDLAAIGVNKIITDRNLMPTPRLTSITSPLLFNKNPWAEVKTGTGTIVYSGNPLNAQPDGEVVVCEAGAGDSAAVRFPFTITSGEVIELTVFARNIGGHPDDGSLNVNRPAVNRKNSLNIRSTEMIEYRVNYQAPWLETFASYEGAFDLGVVSSRDSGVKLYRPVMASTHSGFGSNRVIMQGCIVLASGGTPENHLLDPDTMSNNVDAIITNGNKIDIKPQRETQLLNSAIYRQYPFSTVHMVDTGQDTLFLSITADSRFSTGNLRVTCRDSSGVEVDLSTLATEHRFYFKVEM